MFSKITLTLVEEAIREDLGSGDVTTEALIDPALQAKANIIAKEELLVCGHEVAKTVFKKFDETLDYQVINEEGKKISSGEIIAKVKGNFASILKAERLVLNFLQRLSGIATKTSELANLIKHTPAKILDTRKTTPGWRELEKYAVKVGGGFNHRIGLYDQFLIKNNHIDALGWDIQKAIKLAKKNNPRDLKIEVEVRNLEEFKLALQELPDIIMFDNMTPGQIKEGILFLHKASLQAKIKTEASGNIQRDNIINFAETGVDFISLGMITHSVKAVDISLRYEK